MGYIPHFVLFYKNNILIPDKPEYKLIIYYNSKFDNIQYIFSFNQKKEV